MQTSEAEEVYAIDNFENRKTENSILKGFERFVFVHKIPKRQALRSKSLGKLGGLVKQVRMSRFETKPEIHEKSTENLLKNRNQVSEREISTERYHNKTQQDEGSQIYIKVNFYIRIRRIIL